MRETKLALDLEELNVDTFSTDVGSEATYASEVRLTVLYHTEQISCGGTCGTCPVCWA